MEEHWKRSDIRRLVWIAVGSMLGLVILLKILIGDVPSDSTSLTRIGLELLDGTITALIATLVLTAIVAYASPSNLSRDRLRVVYPGEISNLFDEELIKSNRWEFVGGFGRFVRTRVLPELASRALSRHIPIHLSAVILDPRNKTACQAMARHRNAIHNVDGKHNWDVKSIQIQLASTIVMFARHAAASPGQEIRLYLSGSFNLQRIDIGENRAFITYEDRLAPAISYHKNFYLYQSQLKSAQICRGQAKPVALEKATRGHYHVTAKYVEETLRACSVTVSGFGSDDFKIIAKICEDAINPYA